MSLYEHVFIARPDLSTAQVETLTNQFSTLIESLGGKVKKIEHCGLRTLAYRIRKNRKAYYVLMNLDCPSAALLEMERQMRLNEDVMRYLSVSVEEHEEGVSALSFKKTEGYESQSSSPRPYNRENRDGGYRRQAQPVSESDSEPAVQSEAIN